MKLIYEAAEIERAVWHYARSKVSRSDPNAFDFDVHVHWRAKKATVEVRRKIPVLTDAIPEEAK